MKARVGVGILAASTMIIGLAAAPSARAEDRLTLWKIVRLKCMRHLAKAEAAVPCDYVDVSGGDDRGIALFKDSNGVGRMFAIATGRVTGIEDPAAIAPDAPNYFSLAWAGKGSLVFHLRRPLRREQIAVSVDSRPRRDQDQLYFNVDCVDRGVAAALRAEQGGLDEHWRPMNVELNGRRYWARRVDSPDLADVSPFRMLAEDLPGAAGAMGDWSLAAVAADFDGKPGFVLLADKVEGDAGGRASDLQDRGCAVATAPM